MTSRVKNILNFLNKHFPFAKSDKDDKTGLLFGILNAVVKKVLVTLDLTKKVFDTAIENQVNLIITHHPFLFEKTREEEIKKYPYKKELIDRIENTGMNVIAMHTNYDKSKNGTRKQVWKELGYNEIFLTGNYGSWAIVNKSYKELAQMFTLMGISFTQTNCASEKANFEKVGIIPGAGPPEEILALAKETSVIITSDIKWSTWILASEMQIQLVEIPHYIEEVFVKHLQRILTRKFTKIETNMYLLKQKINN